MNWKPLAARTHFEPLTVQSLETHWERLHQGDREPAPDSDELASAWLAHHNGDFQAAFEAGCSLESRGLYVAGKALMVHAIYLTDDDDERLDQYQQAAELADQLITSCPDAHNGYYLKAFALGRYSQCISVTKALTQGLGGKIREALDTVIQRCPEHADAHTALGLYHAEIIDKIGSMIGKMTYGVSEKQALKHFSLALELAPDSAIARMERANGLLMIQGDKAMDEATELYVQASQMAAADAMEALDIDLAREELE